MEVLDGSWKPVAGELQFLILIKSPDGTYSRRMAPVTMTPYMYGLKSLVSEAGLRTSISPRITVIDDGAKSWDGQELVRIEFPKPGMMGEIRKMLGAGNTFEGDVSYARRMFIDTTLQVPGAPKDVGYFDIEVDTSKGMPDESLATERITSISLVGRDGYEAVFCDDDEKKMLTDFDDARKQFGVLCTWYGGKFDIPYLQNRIKRELPGKWLKTREFVHIDLASVYRDIMLRPPPFGLEAVAQKELGHGKVDIGMPIAQIGELFVTDREKLKAYNLKDSLLLRELDEKFGLVQLAFRIARLAYCPVSEMFRFGVGGKHGGSRLREFSISVPIDSLLLKLAGDRKPRMILPSKRWTPGEERSFKGAHVFPTQAGIWKNVITLDFKSLYPSIIRTFNMGLETYRDDGSGDIKAWKGTFVSKPRSLLSEMLAMADVERTKYKELRAKEKPKSAEWQKYDAIQWAWKTLKNAAYGVQGSPFSRFFKREVAENVTQVGQILIKRAAAVAEDYGFPLIYGDTDSVGLKAPDDLSHAELIELAQHLSAMLTDNITDFVREEYPGVRDIEVQLEVDAVFKAMVFTGREGKGVKKKYAGLVIWQDGQDADYMKVVGFETVRYDWCRGARAFQKALLRKLLEFVPASEIARFVAETKAKVFSGDMDADLVVYKGLNKNLPAYKVLPPHVRAAKQLVAQGHVVRRGDKIGYIKFGAKPPQVAVVPTGMEPDIGLTADMYSYIWRHQFAGIAERLNVSEYITKSLKEFV